MENQFDFLISDELDVFVKFDFFKIEREEDFFSVNLYGIEKDIRDLLQNGNEIYLNFRGSSWCINFVIIDYSLIMTDGNFSIKINAPLDSFLNEFSDNFYAELFYSWKKNEKKIKWYNLSTMQKQIWLNACGSIKNIGFKNFISDTIHLDFKKLENILDFYCYFGEKCLGYRGYMGSNLDALDDMLCDINLKSIENTVFYLHNFDVFRDKLKQLKKVEKYKINHLDILLKIFENKSIKYIFK